ncbi:hypothetical protein CMUS01_06232 [Colletotrichum musicola]|uniref:Uncharacterized protein n=1 Tax=Colletotrichum musicola TaxID=2175873 RepID=A0A8H6KMH0_9PEZI|nr:hypothetical protein CMUS01_06232 [Colletotrichum musicola]
MRQKKKLEMAGLAPAPSLTAGESTPPWHLSRHHIIPLHRTVHDIARNSTLYAFDIVSAVCSSSHLTGRLSIQAPESQDWWPSATRSRDGQELLHMVPEPKLKTPSGVLKVLPSVKHAYLTLPTFGPVRPSVGGPVVVRDLARDVLPRCLYARTSAMFPLPVTNYYQSRCFSSVPSSYYINRTEYRPYGKAG